jgi:hypothetical protein
VRENDRVAGSLGKTEQSFSPQIPHYFIQGVINIKSVTPEDKI